LKKVESTFASNKLEKLFDFASSSVSVMFLVAQNIYILIFFENGQSSNCQ